MIYITSIASIVFLVGMLLQARRANRLEEEYRDLNHCYLRMTQSCEAYRTDLSVEIEAHCTTIATLNRQRAFRRPPQWYIHRRIACDSGGYPYWEARFNDVEEYVEYLEYPENAA